MANVLALCQDAATEVKLSAPSAVIGISNDPDAVLLTRALIKTCRQLQAYDWQKLVREKTFTTVAAETQTDTPLPTDLLRFISKTIFNRTKRLPVGGPLSPLEWQSIKATAQTSSYDYFRLRGNAWLMSPTPSAGDTIAYEYITKNLGTDSTGVTERSAFSADADLTYFDDELMVLGISMNVLDIDGNDYAERSMQFQTRLSKMLIEDQGSRLVSSRPTGVRPMPPVVPDFVSYT